MEKATWGTLLRRVRHHQGRVRFIDVDLNRHGLVLATEDGEGYMGYFTKKSETSPRKGKIYWCRPQQAWSGASHRRWRRLHGVLYYTAIFLQTSRYRHVSVTVWEPRHIKTFRPVQNRGLTWYRRSHMGTLAFNSHCTWTRQCSHPTVQFPQRHVRC